MNELAMIIGENIDALRLSKGITKTDLASLLGVTRPTLDNYIKGRQIIDCIARRFELYANQLQVSKQKSGEHRLTRAKTAHSSMSTITVRLQKREKYSVSFMSWAT